MCIHYIDGTSIDRAGVGRVITYRPLMVSKGGPNMAERAIVCFNEASLDTFYVHLPAGGDIKTVAKTLESVSLPAGSYGYTSTLDAGEITAEFVKQHRTKYPKTKLTANLNNHAWYTDLVYTVDVKNLTVKVQEVHFGKIGTKLLFSGTVEYFYKWADSNRDLHKAVDKIVKFVYKGGSGTQERIVKVTSVTGSGSGMLIKGWDVHKSTGDKPAYRCYRIGNIIGNVQVVG
jgi:hypothetical protein